MDNWEKLQKENEYALNYFKRGKGTGFPDIDRACFIALQAHTCTIRENRVRYIELQQRAALTKLNILEDKPHE